MSSQDTPSSSAGSLLNAMKAFVELEIPKVKDFTQALTDEHMNSPNPWSVDSKSKKTAASSVAAELPFKASFTGKRPQVRVGGGHSAKELATKQSSALHPVPEGSDVTPQSSNINDEAARLEVTPLYLAVYHDQYDLVTLLLRQGHNPNTKVDPKKLPVKPEVKYRLRQSTLPTLPLELAIASNDSHMVDILMEGGAVLQIPKQLSLEEMKEKSKAHAQSGRRTHVKTSDFGLGWGVDGLGDGFLEDEEVQQTLAWREHEANLLSHANSHIVERILRRQSYQLSLTMSTAPQAIKTIFETAVAEGNLYVIKAMLEKGIDINQPTQRREQYPLSVAINTLQSNLIKDLIALGAKLQDDHDELYHTYSSVKLGGKEGKMWYPFPAACLAWLAVAQQLCWPVLAQESVDDVRLRLAAESIEVLVKVGVKVPKNIIALLGKESPLREQPKHVVERYSAVLSILVGQDSWSVDNHTMFPRKFQDEVKLMLLTSVNALHNAAEGVLTEVIEEAEEEEGEAEEEAAANGDTVQPIASSSAHLEGLSLGDQQVDSTASKATGAEEEGESGVEVEEAEEEEEETVDVLATASPEDLLKIAAMAKPLSKWF